MCMWTQSQNQLVRAIAVCLCTAAEYMTVLVMTWICADRAECFGVHIPVPGILPGECDLIPPFPGCGAVSHKCAVCLLHKLCTF